MMYGVDCRRSNWIEGRIVLTHMSNVLCQGSDFSKMFLQGVDVPHSFPVRMDGSMIDNSLVIGSSIGLNGEFSATNVTFILSAIVPNPEPPAVTFNKENYRDLWEDDIKARSPEKKQNVMLYSSLEGYHAAPEDFTEQLTGYKFALCKNQGLIHGFRRECQGYALDHSSAYGMDKKDKMINAHKRGLIPGIMATTYNARLPNLLISCQLALFAKELSDEERIVLCPSRYGSATAKIAREKLSTDKDFVPYKLKNSLYEKDDHEISYEKNCKEDLIKAYNRFGERNLAENKLERDERPEWDCMLIDLERSSNGKKLIKEHPFIYTE